MVEDTGEWLWSGNLATTGKYLLPVFVVAVAVGKVTGCVRPAVGMDTQCRRLQIMQDYITLQ